MQGGSFAEGTLQLGRLHGCDARGVEVADAAPELGRSGEGLLDGHLLVQCKADQQGEGVAGQEPIGLVVAGEGEAFEGGCGGGGHAGMVPVSASPA